MYPFFSFKLMRKKTQINIYKMMDTMHNDMAVITGKLTNGYGYGFVEYGWQTNKITKEEWMKLFNFERKVR